MTLTSLPGNMPRLEAVRAMLKVDAGKVDEVRKVHSDKIAAFVIEPSGSGESAFLLPHWQPSAGL